MNSRIINRIKIIQHNVLAWTYQRSIELGNYYRMEDADIILLNATGRRDTDRIKLYNYNVHQRNVSNEAHAGVAIAVKKGIQYKIIEEFEDDFLGIQLDTSRGLINLVTVYRPPRRYLCIPDVMKTQRKNELTYLIGDLNLRHPFIGHTDRNNPGIIFSNLVNNNSYQYMGPDFGTMAYRGDNSKPDIVFNNNKGHLHYRMEQGQITTSDHLPLLMTLSTSPIMYPIKERYVKKLTKWDKFEKGVEIDMKQRETDVSLTDRSHREIDIVKIDQEINQWTDIISRHYDENTPKKKFVTIPHGTDSDLMKVLKETYKNIRENALIYDVNIRRNIQFIQEELQRESIRINTEHWNTMMENLDDIYRDPVKFWKEVRRLQGSKKKEENTYIVGENNTRYHSPEDKLAAFKTAWEPVFEITEEENRNFDRNTEDMVNGFIENNKDRTEPYVRANLDRLNADSFMTKPIETWEIVLIIKQFKHKSPGEDGITKQIMEKLPMVAKRRLKDIFNILLSMGYYSVIYKNGLMVFAEKPGKDGKNPINYRPISLLRIPGKIFEKIINNRFTQYLEEERIFNKNQFGFRKGKGTEIAIMKIYESIAISQHNRERCMIVCRDISKAFDKVWIRGLQYKILQLRLPDIMEKLLCNFLVLRTAQVRMFGNISDKLDLKSGVPQGSILSPTMFVFYTSDLPPPDIRSEDILFADDISQVIVSPHRSRERLVFKTTNAIKRINEYEKQWKIQTNKNKFQMLQISATKKLPVEIDGDIIPYATQVNTLGFQMKRTGFVSHIRTRKNMALATVTRLKRFRRLKTKIKVHLYKALVRSQVDYPNTPMCIMSTSNKRSLQSMQNKIIRNFIAPIDEKYDPIEELHNRYNIEAVNIRMQARAKKTWSKFEQQEPELAAYTRQLNTDDINDHRWWRRIGAWIDSQDEEPFYV